MKRLNRWLVATAAVRAGCRELAAAGLRVAATLDGRMPVLLPAVRAALTPAAVWLADHA